MADYQSKSYRFELRGGLDLNHPVDLIDEGRYPIAKNVRALQDGGLTTRPAHTQIGTQLVSAAVLAIRRLNDAVNATWTRIISISTKLFAGQTSFSEIDSGYSGRPASLVPARPPQSVKPFMYVSEAARTRKVRSDGVDYTWGLPAPSEPPTIALGAPNYTTISDFQSSGSFTQGGTAGAPSNVNRVNAVSISQILYDTGSTGWANVNLATFDENIQAGMFLTTSASAETVKVESVHEAIPDTTIAAIVYDSGSTGLCTIQLTGTPSKKWLKRDALIRIASAENCRIQSVNYGPDGSASIRVSTTGTRSAGNAIAGLRSFRAYFANTHAAAETVSTIAVRTSVTEGIGTLTQSSLTLNCAVVNNRAVEDDDYIAIQLRVDDLGVLTEIRGMLDVDNTTNDFTRNYYFFTIRPPDITAAVQQNEIVLTPREARIRRKLFDALQRDDQDAVSRLQKKLANVQKRLAAGDGEIGSLEGITGDNQWATIFYKIKDLQRVGSDTSKTLADVKAIRVNINCTDTVQVDMDAWWVGGTYGPDVSDIGADYEYMIRFRSRETGEVSQWSPKTRSGLRPRRQRVDITPAAASSEAQCDLIDVARRGGALNFWKYVISGDNAASAIHDDYDDVYVFSDPTPIDFDNFQPFPVLDLPRTGVCNVVGNKVTRVSGDNFDTSWAMFTPITINGVAATLYAPPTSTSVLELNQSLNNLSSVKFYVPAGLLQGQPLKCVWGPYGGGEFGEFIFGCGHDKEPGTLFWCKNNNPDSASDKARIEVTTPSDPLMNGIVWNSLNWVFSTNHIYRISPAFSQLSQFVPQSTPAVRGLFARWGITAGPFIWFVGKDGIYRFDGGQVENITDAFLYKLFPHYGQDGETTYGIVPPDYSQPDTFRLCYAGEYLYFDFINTSSQYSTLVLDLRTSMPVASWVQDVYGTTVTCHYEEEGESNKLLLVGRSDGTIAQVATSGKDSTAACQVRSGSFDQGDPRSRKRYGDGILDYETGSGVNITATFSYDNHTASDSGQTAAASTTRTQKILDCGTSALGDERRNIDLDLAWTGDATIYLWEASYIPKAPNTTKRVTDWDDLGFQGAKWVQGLRFRADTANVAKDFKVQSDRGTNGAPNDEQSFTFTANGESVSAFTFDTPFICHLVRLVPTDSDSWRLLSQVEWIFEPEPEFVEEWITQPQSFGLQGFLHSRAFQIPHRSEADWKLRITVDGVNYDYTIPSSSNNLVKTYVVSQVSKGKVWQLSALPITSTKRVRIYQKDVEVHVKEWGSSGQFQVLKPFGHPHAVQGALI